VPHHAAFSSLLSLCTLKTTLLRNNTFNIQYLAYKFKYVHK
jgi:hypothetical protein